MQAVVEAVFILECKAVGSCKSGVVVAVSEAFAVGIRLYHLVEFYDVRTLGFWIAEAAVRLVAGGNGTKDNLDICGGSLLRHRGDVLQNLVFGDSLCKVVGSAHDHHNAGPKVEYIPFIAREHLGCVLRADTVVDIFVTAEEFGMPAYSYVVSRVFEPAREGVQWNHYLAFCYLPGICTPLPGDAVADEHGHRSFGCLIRRWQFCSTVLLAGEKHRSCKKECRKARF